MNLEIPTTSAEFAHRIKRIRNRKLELYVANSQLYSGLFQLKLLRPGHFPIVLLIVLFCISPIAGRLCENGICKNFECDSDRGSKYRAMEYFERPGRTVFDRPCKCDTDWKRAFCETNFKDLALMPNICVCRQSTDGGRNCQQFMTRCYQYQKERLKSCHCCFNQPGDHCNQLPCQNGEPFFEKFANTTCVCFGADESPTALCGTGLYTKSVDPATAVKTTSSRRTTTMTTQKPSRTTTNPSSLEFDHRGWLSPVQHTQTIWPFEPIPASSIYTKSPVTDDGPSRRRDVVDNMQLFGLRLHISRRMAIALLAAFLVLIAFIVTIALIIKGWRMRRKTGAKKSSSNGVTGDGTLLKPSANDATCYVPS